MQLDSSLFASICTSLLVTTEVIVFFFVVLYICVQENRIINVYQTLQFTVQFQSLLMVMDFLNKIF